VQTALEKSASAALCSRLFCGFCLLGVGATCTGFFLCTSGGRTPKATQGYAGDQSGKTQTGQQLFKFFFFHKRLLRIEVEQTVDLLPCAEIPMGSSPWVYWIEKMKTRFNS